MALWFYKFVLIGVLDWVPGNFSGATYIAEDNAAFTEYFRLIVVVDFKFGKQNFVLISRQGTLVRYLSV